MNKKRRKGILLYISGILTCFLLYFFVSGSASSYAQLYSLSSEDAIHKAEGTFYGPSEVQYTFEYGDYICYLCTYDKWISFIPLQKNGFVFSVPNGYDTYENHYNQSISVSFWTITQCRVDVSTDFCVFHSSTHAAGPLFDSIFYGIRNNQDVTRVVAALMDGSTLEITEFHNNMFSLMKAGKLEVNQYLAYDKDGNLLETLNQNGKTQEESENL